MRTPDLAVLACTLLFLTACSKSSPLEFEEYSAEAVQMAGIEGDPLVIKATAKW